jgi:pimeloyl-ACP methyl ester carboxylesterase
VRDKAMHRLGVGTTHDMNSVIRGVVWPSLRSTRYTPGEKVRLWRGKLSSGVSALWGEMLATDLADRVAELALPAYFFHGAYDYTVNYQLAKEYVERLKAPLKGFYTFERSAHVLFWKNPKRPGEYCARTSWRERSVSLTVLASSHAGLSPGT